MKPTPPQSQKSQFAVCIDNSEYPASLELRRVYRLVPDDDAAKDGDLRIVDESGEDYLYPASSFLVLSVSRQAAKVLNESFGDGGMQAAPPARTAKAG